MKILLTGATGFIGTIVARLLIKNGHNIVATCRKMPASTLSSCDFVCIPSIDESVSWFDYLSEIEAVVHLAARAHVLSETSSDPLEDFRKVNTRGTLHLASCAAQAGVKRFIFLSSIGVNGNQSNLPFDETSAPNPIEPYALSKWEAEEGLKKISEQTSMEHVIIRPPLVYGPNCPGNFLALLKLIHKSIPLPLGTINNKRSLIGVDNLADFVLCCIHNPAAKNKTFLIADDTDISTPELIRTLAKGMERNCILFPFPYKLLIRGTALIGKSSAVEKLCGNLQVDADYARKTLTWKQPVAQPDGLAMTAKWYASQRLTNV